MSEANKPRMEGDKHVPGIRFSQKIWDAFRALADENGPINDSRHGLAGYYRYNPRRIEKLTNTKEVTVKRCKIHESVLRRIKIGQDGYAPFVLPPGFAVMGFDGSIADGAKYLQTDIDDKSQWAKQREHVWNWVWWRRVAYFATLFTTLALVAMPLKWPALPKGACTSKVCFLSDVIDSVAAAMLPGFTATWTDSFSSHPDVFLILAVLIILGLWAGGVFECYVRDAMRPIWYGIPNTSPRTIPPPPSPAIDQPGRPVAAHSQTLPMDFLVFDPAFAAWCLPCRGRVRRHSVDEPGDVRGPRLLGTGLREWRET